MEAITISVSLSEFYQSGYMTLVLQAGQATGHTIAGRKASLLFICKMVSHYDTTETLRLVSFCTIQINQCCQGYFDQLLDASLDILRSLSQRADRKYLFNAICRIIQIKYFNLYSATSRTSAS